MLDLQRNCKNKEFMDILHPASTSDSRFYSHSTVIKARKGTRVQYFYCILCDVL